MVETGGDGATAKRLRDDGPAGGGPTGPPVKKPALSLEALEKAKKALQLQKELKEKLKNLPQLQKAAQAPAPAAAPVPEANALLLSATAKAAQIAAGFGVPVALPPALAGQAPLASAGVGAAGAVRPQGAGGSFRPAPLRLDPQGREIDERGNVIARPVQVVTTLKVNQQHTATDMRRAAAAGTASTLPSGASIPGTATVNPLLVPSAPPSVSELEADPGFDPRMGAPGLKKMDRRRKATFDFVQEGAFQKQAEMMRLKAKYGDAVIKRPLLPKGPIGPTENPNDVPIGVNPNLAPLGGDPNQVPIGVRREVSPALGAMDDDAVVPKVLEPPPPDVEWWDKHLLASGSYEWDVKDEGCTIKENKITAYVEHPVPIQPPAEPEAPPPQPLKLTKKELKKLRTQRRQAREKEKQDLIRQGLLEPPKPKVKIANLYRVLGEQAVADPTAMEKEARKQMAERQAAHEDRNLARKLLPGEKRDKKLKKLFDDSGLDTITTVYKLSRLDNKQHRFKVDINAKENHMTGMILMSESMCLVIVEGCAKSTKRMMKLMLRRIDWAQEPEQEEEEEGMDEDVAQKEPNCCDMVWQGVVKDKAFKKFHTETLSDATQAKALLDAHNVGHYWDVAATFDRNEAPRVVLD